MQRVALTVADRVRQVGLARTLLLLEDREGGTVRLEAHDIGMAGFAVLIIGMVTRTALGHLGRPLQTDRSMVASYALVIAAVVLRLLALMAVPFALAALHAAALAWIIAFALYLWRFFPMMVRPRTP